MSSDTTTSQISSGWVIAISVSVFIIIVVAFSYVWVMRYYSKQHEASLCSSLQRERESPPSKSISIQVNLEDKLDWNDIYKISSDVEGSIDDKNMMNNVYRAGFSGQ